MRTDQAPRSALPQVRVFASRARQRFLTLGLRVRWTAAGLLLAGLALGGYLLAVAEPVTYEWLFDGQTFPRSEMVHALVALKAADIPCSDDRGRLSVPLDRRAEAIEALARAKIGPRPLDELLNEAAEPPSLMLDPRQVAHRERRLKERVAEAAIRRTEGIISASVLFNPIETGTALRPQQKWRAWVMVETEKDTQLSSKTVQHIRHTLEGIQPGLESDGLTLQDLRSGADYSVAGRPDVEVLSKVKVREEELRDRIVEQIGIDGARVLVRIDAVPSRSAKPEPAVEPGPLVNQPISVVEPESVEELEPLGRTTILVRVPRSYYLRLFQASNPRHEPSADDLKPIVTRTQQMIETVVDAALPAGAECDLTIDRIDDLTPVKPTVPASDNELMRALVQAWWLPAAAAGLTTALVLTLGGRIVASRWPLARPARLATAGGFEAEDTAGPSERVRELVRLDPEAAAGVLHRWIGQGGHLG